ncbi:unnamed protein product [Brachionus calyciflorus]|uniref:LITAF domain-containing protein n=1 Tax=Brachionus calyciflorus TaxID=104777 RepID=A0A814A026_9BILA|nr:unnamed protein product [Brachionus calyciflorus]
MAGYPKQGAYSDLPPAYTDDGFAGGSSQVGFKTEGQLPEPTAPTQVFIQAQSQIPVAQPSVVYVGVPIRLGDHPTQTVCPNCRANVSTNIKYETGLITWLIAGALCFFGLGCGCCLIPFCVDSCKDVEHFCPNCRYMIGRNRKL